MGESRSNPRSTQFAGKLPAEMLLCGLEVRARVKPEWLAANPEATGDPPEDQVECAILMVVGRTEPSALYPGQPNLWPKCEQPPAIGPVLIMTDQGPTPAVLTLAEFRRLTPINGRTKPADKEPSSGLVLGSDVPWEGNS